MFTSMIYFLFLTLSALCVNASGKWEFYSWGGLPGMISYGRLDPIISPGQVSPHVHQISGANAMQATYDYDTLREQSTCTSVQVQDDLSNYWTPAMYHYDGANNFTLMLARFSIYYMFNTFSYDANNASGSDTRVAFPEGLVLLAGDMYQRKINGSDPTSTAGVYQCQRSSGNSPYSHDIRDFQKSGMNCDASLRATIDFPSCWDGVADNSDLSHVVYPIRGVCPKSHPHALMHMLQEYYWPVQDFPFDPTRQDNWVLSFGDTSGFGLHADFVNGWNTTLLTEAINDPTCNSAEAGIEKCETFSRWNHTTIPPCIASGLYPNENVGLNQQSLTSLPGCNPLWTDNSTKPTCSEEVTPSINLQLGPNLTNYNYVSCPFGFTTTGPMLTNFTLRNAKGLDQCLDVCSNYTYIGVTQQPEGALGWVTECWCDNELRNNYTVISDPWYPCQQRCPGKYSELCGGYGSWQLYERCEGMACHQNSAFPSYSTLSIATPTISTKATPTATTISVQKTTVTTKNTIASSQTSASIAPASSVSPSHTSATSSSTLKTSSSSSTSSASTSSTSTSSTSTLSTSTFPTSTSSTKTSSTDTSSTTTSSIDTPLTTQASSSSMPTTKGEAHTTVRIRTVIRKNKTKTVTRTKTWYA